jgi:outer membrane protein assembly factor BamD
VLKSTDYEYKYRKALQYYEKKDYARAITLYEQIINYYRATVRGDSAIYFYAQSLYGQEDYVTAAYYFQELSNNYSRSPFVEEADFLNGYCYYLMSPRPSLDQENTNLAKASLQKFVYKHPNSQYVPECKRIIEELDQKLATKAYLNAKLYYDLEYYKAAIIALQNCITNYPNSQHREELRYMLLVSNFKLANNSIEEKKKERFQNTLDEYYTFISEYPKSKYASNVEKIYLKTKSVLGI